MGSGGRGDLTLIHQGHQFLRAVVKHPATVGNGPA
jgi:hypothetical protein